MMQGITKETFLKANDPKNRDAMLFDMLKHINEKMDSIVQVKKDISKCEKQLSYIKGIGTAISVIFSGILAWMAKS
jgi:hypothetical protein